MAMAVHHRLPGRCANVDPEVIAGRLEIFLNDTFARINQANHRLFLFNSH
jgi:hypothetical protein